MNMIFLSFIMSRKDNKLGKDESLPICESFIRNIRVLPFARFLPEYRKESCPPSAPVRLRIKISENDDFISFHRIRDIRKVNHHQIHADTSDGWHQSALVYTFPAPLPSIRGYPSAILTAVFLFSSYDPPYHVGYTRLFPLLSGP